MKKSVKNTIKILVVILILCLIGLGTFLYYHYKSEAEINKIINKINHINQESFLDYDNVIEYGDSWDYETILKNLLDSSKLYDGTEVIVTINDKDLSDEGRIDFFNINGEVIKITLNKKIEKQIVTNEKSFNINVVDTNAPIIDGITNKTVYLNDTIDLKSGIKAYDVVDGELAFEISGDVNTKKEGTYHIKVIAKDKNNLITEEDFDVKVKKKSVPKTNTIKSTNDKLLKSNNGVYEIDGIIIVNKTYSLPSDYNLGLRPEFKSAFNTMQSMAAQDGITLKVVSGFRSYENQKQTYNNYVSKVGKEQADMFSARPGHSEHQLGLAADINTASSSDHFENSKEYEWLMANCYKYGFILRYVYGKQDITGYKYEPWHYRYVGPELATILYNNGEWITLEEYFGISSIYKD